MMGRARALCLAPLSVSCAPSKSIYVLHTDGRRGQDGGRSGSQDLSGFRSLREASRSYKGILYYASAFEAISNRYSLVTLRRSIYRFFYILEPSVHKEQNKYRVLLGTFSQHE